MPEKNQSELALLRAQRNSEREKAKKIAHELCKMVSRFANDSGKAEISYAELEKCKVGETFCVNDKVSFIRQKSGENELVFITHMKPNGTFGFQKHDCLEIVKVIQGNLIERCRDDRVYKEGEMLTYNIGEMHKPSSDTESIYEVTFIKNKNIH